MRTVLSSIIGGIVGMAIAAPIVPSTPYQHLLARVGGDRECAPPWEATAERPNAWGDRITSGWTEPGRPTPDVWVQDVGSAPTTTTTTPSLVVDKCIALKLSPTFKAEDGAPPITDDVRARWVYDTLRNMKDIEIDPTKMEPCKEKYALEIVVDEQTVFAIKLTPGPWVFSPPHAASGEEPDVHVGKWTWSQQPPPSELADPRGAS